MPGTRVFTVAVIAFVLGGGLSWVATSHAKSDKDTSVATVHTSAKVPVLWAPSGKASIRHLAKGKNAYIGLLRMAANGKVPEHRDTDEEYIYVLEGAGQLTIDGRKYPIGPGTTIFMPAGAKVSYVNGAKPLVALQVFAGPKSAAKYRSWKTK